MRKILGRPASLAMTSKAASLAAMYLWIDKYPRSFCRRRLTDLAISLPRSGRGCRKLGPPPSIALGLAHLSGLAVSARGT